MEIELMDPQQTNAPVSLQLEYWFKVRYTKDGIDYNPDVNAYVSYFLTDKEEFYRDDITLSVFSNECPHYAEFEPDCIKLVETFAPLLISKLEILK